jgi:hypothetical protein
VRKLASGHSGVVPDRRPPVAEIVRVDLAELEQVRQARTKPRRTRLSWEEVGRALNVTHTQARRRFADRLESGKTDTTRTTKQVRPPAREAENPSD